MLGIAGVMGAFDAIWALRLHGQVPQDLGVAVFGHSLRAYGGVHRVAAVVRTVCGGGALVESPSRAGSGPSSAP